jgi:glucose-1-phosphate thymidylyltransferase
LGKRLDPLTRVANKHLLPVYDRPMIHYPLDKIASTNIREVLIVCGQQHESRFESLLFGDPQYDSINFTFVTQVGEEGIAAALALAEDFAAGKRMLVILGDNLFQDELADEVARFERQKEGARILLKKVPNPERFGVPVFDGDDLVRIEEKPSSPKSPYAVTGIYFYDCRVFDIIRTLRPSDRGEYEITDVSNVYINNRDLTYGYLDGWWSDCGTFDSLYRASGLVRQTRIADKETEFD